MARPSLGLNNDSLLHYVHLEKIMRPFVITKGLVWESNLVNWGAKIGEENVFWDEIIRQVCSESYFQTWFESVHYRAEDF